MGIGRLIICQAFWFRLRGVSTTVLTSENCVGEWLGIRRIFFESTSLALYGNVITFDTVANKIISVASSSAARFTQNILEIVRRGRSPVINVGAFLRRTQEMAALFLAKDVFVWQNLPEPPSGSQKAVGLAMQYIDAFFRLDISMVDLAQFAGTSLRDLQRKFSLSFGRSITQVIRQRRLDQARAYLLNPQDIHSVSGVAFACGFNHLGDFGRYYRAAYGETPLQTLSRTMRS